MAGLVDTEPSVQQNNVFGCPTGSAVAFDTPDLPSLPSAGEVLKGKTSTGSNAFDQLKGKVDQSADNVKKLGQKGKDAANGSIATKPVSLQFNVADSKVRPLPSRSLHTPLHASNIL